MPFEITNSLRTKSAIRVVGNTATRINLSQLVATSDETVQSAAVAQVSSVSDGIWRIYRGNDATGVLIFELPNFAHYQLSEFDMSVANSATSNVFITNSGTAGTLILQLAKNSTFDPPQTGL